MGVRTNLIKPGVRAPDLSQSAISVCVRLSACVSVYGPDQIRVDWVVGAMTSQSSDPTGPLL